MRENSYDLRLAYLQKLAWALQERPELQEEIEELEDKIQDDSWFASQINEDEAITLLGIYMHYKYINLKHLLDSEYKRNTQSKDELALILNDIEYYKPMLGKEDEIHEVVYNVCYNGRY